MKCGTCCFKFKGIYYAFGTKFIATDEFYEAWNGQIPYGTEIFFSENNEKLKLLSCYTHTKDNHHISILVQHKEVKEITIPYYFGGITKRTQKLIDEQNREKETGRAGPLTTQIIEREEKTKQIHNDIEENFNAWLVFLVAMGVATIFKANIFLWAMIILWFSIYKIYEHK